MSSANIELRNVSKTFQDQTVLDQVSVMFTAGQIHGIIGKNGSGKTVLLKSICGLIPLSSGEILRNNNPVTSVKGEMGVIIETPGFIPSISGFKNLLYLARLRNRISKSDISEAMVSVGLSPESKQPVGKYSLGMRQRLGIAQAIMEDPEVLLLDEPLNGLDSDGCSEISQLLIKKRDEGKTIIIASHSSEDVRYLCDTVYRIDAGKLLAVAKDSIGTTIV